MEAEILYYNSLCDEDSEDSEESNVYLKKLVTKYEKLLKFTTTEQLLRLSAMFSMSSMSSHDKMYRNACKLIESRMDKSVDSDQWESTGSGPSAQSDQSAQNAQNAQRHEGVEVEHTGTLHGTPHETHEN